MSAVATVCLHLDTFAAELDGGPTAGPDLCEGIYTVAVLQAMERCLERGAPVKIAEVLGEHGLAELMQPPNP